MEGEACSQHLRCILKCALDLSCLEMHVYLALIKYPGSDVEFLAEKLGRDSNTIYKALRNLMEKGLVKREYRILRSGGYKYIYKPIEFDEFKKIALEKLERWIREVNKVLELVENGGEGLLKNLD